MAFICGLDNLECDLILKVKICRHFNNYNFFDKDGKCKDDSGDRFEDKETTEIEDRNCQNNWIWICVLIGTYIVGIITGMAIGG